MKCNNKTRTTIEKYFIKGINTSNPSIEKVFASNAKTAIGVNDIIIKTILLKILFKLSIKFTNSGISFLINEADIPIKIAKLRTCITLPSTSAAKKFCGKILKIKLELGSAASTCLVLFTASITSIL